MEFKTFKPHLKLTALVCSIIITVLLIIGIAVFGSLAHGTDKNVQLERLILSLSDAIIIVAMIWLLNYSSMFTSAAYVITSKSYITKETKTTITKFTNPWWVHFSTVLFLIAIYFLSITGLIYAYDDNWVDSIKNNWWLALIFFIINLLIFEFDFNYNLYRFNHDQDIISRI